MAMLIIVASTLLNKDPSAKRLSSTLLSNITILMSIDHYLYMKPMISLEFPYSPHFWKSSPQFRKSEEARQKWPILTALKLSISAEKKSLSPNPY